MLHPGFFFKSNLAEADGKGGEMRIQGGEWFFVLLLPWYKLHLHESVQNIPQGYKAGRG